MKTVLYDYLPFVIIFSLVLVGIFVTIYFLTKNSSKNVSFIGLLIGMNNMEILSLSLIILNFLLVVYTLIMKIPFNIYISIIAVLLIPIAFLVLFDFKNMLINFSLNLVSVGILYLGDLVNTLRIENESLWFYFFQIVLNVFGILYLTFISCKFLHNIRKKGVTNDRKN